MKRLRIDGFFTVEAAYVFPLVLMVLFCGMYLCFHCYNSVCGISMLGTAALEICEAEREGRTVDENECRDETATRLDSVLLYGKAEQVDVQTGLTGCRVRASVASVFHIPILLSGHDFPTQARTKEVFWCDTGREQIRRAQCIKLPKTQN